MRLFLVLGLCLGLSAEGWAQAEKAPAAVEAEAAFQEGHAAFKAGQFKRAIQRFEHANMLDSSSVLIYNMARCYSELGEAEKAIYHYKLYLTREPDASDKADVERRIRVTEALLKKLSEAKAQPKPASAPASKPTPQTQPVVKAPPPAPSTSLRPFAYASWALGGVALLAVGYFGLEYTDAQEWFEEVEGTDGQAMKEAQADGDSAASMVNVSLISAGVLLSAGAALFLLEPEAKPEASVSVGPGSVHWRVTF